MKALIPYFALLGCVATHPELHAKWSSFKAEHGKQYAAHVDSARLEAFAENVRMIEEHNARFARGEVSHRLGLNEHSDLTHEEFRQVNFGLAMNRGFRESVQLEQHTMVPASGHVDWREDCRVTEPKTQNNCSSCYAFAAVGLIESALIAKGEDASDLSEQDIVDCTFDKFFMAKYNETLNLGCEGGDPMFTIADTIRRGLATEEDYKYVSGRSLYHGACKNVTRRKLDHLKIRVVPQQSEEKLANALSLGPVMVTVNGENPDFWMYESGIYNNAKCSDEINHVVLLVGWGEEDGQEYWILKNSWGPTWGEKGYMRLAKGYNRCGIVSEDSYYLI